MGEVADLYLLNTYRDFCEIFLIQGHNLLPPTGRKVKTCKHQSNSEYLSLPVEYLVDQEDTEDDHIQLL
ncbi:hypothetical protein EFJ47_10215 [Escherichia coli]|nr:hypothetical protein [Escherichia coli]